MATAASRQSGLRVPAAASARAEPYMAFHSVRTLSSRPGRTRPARASARMARPASTTSLPVRGSAHRTAQDGAALEVPVRR